MPIHWTTRSCDHISRTLRLPVFLQVSLPVLLVLGIAVFAGHGILTQQEDGAVRAIVEHEEVDLKDEVEASLRQLSDVYAGLQALLQPLIDEDADPQSPRLAKRLDDVAERSHVVPCVFAAVVAIHEPLERPLMVRTLHSWVDRVAGWRLPASESFAAPQRLLQGFRTGGEQRVLLSPPEHVELSETDSTTGGKADPIPGAVVWALVPLRPSTNEADAQTQHAVLAAFDVRWVLGHFFYSPRHISWMQTPLGNLHGRKPGDFPSMFAEFQLKTWRDSALQKWKDEPSYRDLIRIRTVMKCVPDSGLEQLWYQQSELVSEDVFSNIPKDAWRVLQTRECRYGEGISSATKELPRFRVSATSKERLLKHQNSVNHLIHLRNGTPAVRWDEQPALQLVGGSANRDEDECVLEYVHFAPPAVVVPSDKWDVAVGIFKREVGADARREISKGYGWAVLAVLAGLTGAGLLLWFITASIRRINEVANDISQKAKSGAPDWLDELPTLPVDRRDEVGDLARAFASMVGAIGSRDTALRDEHRRSQAILENAADGIVTVDHNHAILNYNRAAERLFRWEKQSARGRPIEDVVANPANVQLDELSPSESGIFGRRLSNVIAVRADGTTFPMDLTISQVPLENESIELLIVRDVTERADASQRLHELLAELEAAKQELEARVELRTKQLEEAKDAVDRRNEELIKVNRIHAVGLHSIAHELVAPVTNIDAQCRTMLDFLPSQSREDQEAHLREVASSISNIGDLITILRDAARCQRGEIQLDRQRIRLNVLIEQAIGLLQLDISKRGQRICWHPERADFDLFVDSARCKLVFKNLISNASKYSPSDSEIHIEVTRNNDTAIIAISDQGMGVPEADRARVFEEFHRASNAKDKVQGLGLGLSLARRFLELHNGSISLESHEGIGSTFSVRLPLGPGCERVADCAAPDSSTFRPDWHDRRIAIIDQYPDRLVALTELLQTWHLAIMPDGTTARLIAELSGGVFVPDVVFAGDEDADDVRAALADCSVDRRPRLVWLTTVEPQHAAGMAESQGYAGFLQATLPLSRVAVCAVLESVLGVAAPVTHHH